MSNLRSAVLTLSEDTGRTLSVLKSLSSLEREVFLTTLRPLNVARWAVVVHRLASDHAYRDELSPADIAQARNLARTLVLEAVA